MNENGANSYPTELDPNYPTCERTCAKLRIYMQDLTPAEVSVFLGIRPTSFQEGDKFKIPAEDKRRPKPPAWFLSSEQHVASRDTHHHLDWLTSVLIPHRDALHELQHKSGISMGVVCVWWSAVGHGGPTLWPQQMEALASLNLECSIDIYFFGDD